MPVTKFVKENSLVTAILLINFVYFLAEYRHADMVALNKNSKRNDYWPFYATV